MEKPKGKGVSRRDFLKGLGGGAGARRLFPRDSSTHRRLRPIRPRRLEQARENPW